MTSRHQPQHGADSAYDRFPFRVYIDCYDGGRTSVLVTAMGRHDAKNLAFEKARDLGYDPASVLKIQKVAA